MFHLSSAAWVGGCVVAETFQVPCLLITSGRVEIARVLKDIGLAAVDLSLGWWRFGDGEPRRSDPPAEALFRVWLPLASGGPIVPQKFIELGLHPKIDLQLGFMPDHWCPSATSGRHFATSALAGERIGVPALHAACAKGKDVNVVVVDHGVDPDQLPPGSSFGGHWVRIAPGTVAPGHPPPISRARLRHGTMIARTVLAVAPQATIWDLRVVPEPGDVIARLGDVRAGYDRVLADIAADAQLKLQRWVFVNPWGVYDSRYDLDGYVHDLAHWFNEYIGGQRQADGTFTGGVAQRDVDLVFAAGNAGQFCPSWRQGPTDRGPGRSILGVNGHPAVLSVGAVRADHLWIGYSSQGRSRLGAEKPDLCAPSSFVEAADHARLNSGTSAASAVAAGVVAALRSYRTQQKAPEELRRILRTTATPPPAVGWSERTGWGVINAAEALKQI